MNVIQIRPLNFQSDTWIKGFLTKRWESHLIVSRGVIHDASVLPGFVALFQNEHIGLITYHIRHGECEIISLDSTLESKGVGTSLIEAVKQKAIFNSCQRLWVITTNDNLHALSFYQKRSFHLVTIHRNAIEISRMLKPQIPKIGMDRIPIRDEIELELILD